MRRGPVLMANTAVHLSLFLSSRREKEEREKKNGHTVTCLVYHVFAHIRTTFSHLSVIIANRVTFLTRIAG